MNTTDLHTNQLDPDHAVVNEICAAGEPWSKIVKRGQIFRIVDLEGNQAVDTLFFNAHHAVERYSATHTIRAQNNLYLTTGSKLCSNLGNVMLTIIADGTIHWVGRVRQRAIRYAMHWKNFRCIAAAIIFYMR